MPRYDYKCNSCGIEFELTQTFKEAGSGTCPDCSGEGRRVYHAVPVIYKGSGFYTTDYGRPKPPADNARDANARDGKEIGKESKDSKDSKDSSETKTPTASGTKNESSGTKNESSAKAAATPTPSSESRS